MRLRLLGSLSLLFLAGCGQVSPAPAGPPAAALHASAAKPAEPDAVSEALARFSKQERRKVSARHVKLNDGRGAAELRVRLNAADRALLVQLYRLHPRPLDPSEFPAGLVERAADHLAVLHRFKLPEQAALDPQRLRETLKTRCYKDGEGNVMAYESFLSGDNYMMFGKYDLKGRILKIDIETWEN